MLKLISPSNNKFWQLLISRKSFSLSLLSIASLLLIDRDAKILAQTQIVPDNTLPSNSVVIPDGNLREINGGTTIGNNLFHSFQQFSLSTGDTAWFDNTLDIENIIGRVTGNFISNIDGLIRANGKANLFLINPQGIVFGENAALNIGGSFLGSTADSLKFADGSEFSAVDPQAPPLLTVNLPVGLQYGTNNGDITVQGNSNQLKFNPDFTVNRELRPNGLEVKSEETLALVGGNIFLEEGNLTAKQGKIELGSVADNEFVKLDSNNADWSLDYSQVSNFRDINLANASSLEVSGKGSGDVQLQGKQVIITDGSAILADNSGDIDGGKLQVNAAELLVVAGTSADGESFISRLSTDVAPQATGNGGDIELNARTLIVADGAQVISSTYGSGDTGNIQVKADDLELVSGSRVARASGVFTLVWDSGNGGDVDLAANNIFVLEGAEAAALTFGDGAGGNLDVKANNVEIIGTSRGGTSSSLATNTEGMGNGGNLTIDGEYLKVADGGIVQSYVLTSGNGGNILVKATEVELIGGAPGVGSSGIFANVEADATGNGGKLAIETESLSIAHGAQAAVTNFGKGHVGFLELKANNINLIGTSPNGFPSGFFSNVETSSTGNGGQINIETERLQIADGAQIASITQSFGKGGDIQIKANEIELVGVSSNTPSGFQSTVAPEAEGDGGSLNIDTNSLQIKDGAQIAVSTAGIGNGGALEIVANEIELTSGSEFGASGIFGNAIIGTGDGGNLNIDADDLTILEGATISASNFSSRGTVEPGQGRAGNININANSLKLDRTTAEIPSTITASTNNGSGGQIVIDTSDSITLDHGSQITAETRGDGDGGNIAITTENFKLNNQAGVSVNSIGLGQAGNIGLTAGQSIKTNEGSITATSVESGGGNINLATDFLFLENNSLISTSVTDSTGGGGNLSVDSNYVIARDNSDLRANAVLGQGGNIDILTEVILLSLDSDVDASSQFGLDGVVEIKSPATEEQIGVIRFSEEVNDPTALIAAICPTELDNVMITAGKGGLAENPNQDLRSQSVWEDLRDFDAESQNMANSSTHSKLSKNETIIEADGWAINSRGQVELTSYLSFNQCR